MNTLYKKIKKKNIKPAHVCEVGVYLPETSNVLDFINDDIKTTLVEPDTKSMEQIKKKFKNKTNITLYPVAIYDNDGELVLMQRNASTYVSSLQSSPALVNDNYVPAEKDKFTVPCTTMNKIDDGTIDLLSIDTEGSEWYVIKNLVSRPEIISVETHGRAYTNPFFREITEWMKANNYMLWYKGKTDSVFMKKDLFKISLAEKTAQFFMNVYLGYRKFKYS